MHTLPAHMYIHGHGSIRTAYTDPSGLRVAPIGSHSYGNRARSPSLLAYQAYLSAGVGSAVTRGWAI